jgi:hypothetical protein
VAQGVGPEFKPNTTKKEKKRERERGTFGYCKRESSNMTMESETGVI